MSDTTREEIHDRTGTPAVPFELRDSEGVTQRLADHAGRWLWLVFHRHLA
jgi:peroxiredoxin